MITFHTDPKQLSSVISAKAAIRIRKKFGLDSNSIIFPPHSFFAPSPAPRGREKSEGRLTSSTLAIIGALAIFLFLLVSPAIAATAPDLEDRTREIATELRCVVCQNLSVADSPSEMAQQMRAVVR